MAQRFYGTAGKKGRPSLSWKAPATFLATRETPGKTLETGIQFPETETTALPLAVRFHIQKVSVAPMFWGKSQADISDSPPCCWTVVWGDDIGISLGRGEIGGDFFP